MDAKSLIRLVCPLGAVDSPKKDIALKVVQISLGKPCFNAIFWEMSQIFSLHMKMTSFDIDWRRIHYYLMGIVSTCNCTVSGSISDFIFFSV